MDQNAGEEKKTAPDQVMPADGDAARQKPKVAEDWTSLVEDPLYVSAAKVDATALKEAEEKKKAERKREAEQARREEEEMRWFAGEATKRPTNGKAKAEGVLASGSRIAGKVSEAMPGMGLLALPVLGMVMGLGMFGGGMMTVALVLWGTKLGLEATSKLLRATDEKIDEHKDTMQWLGSKISKVFGGGDEPEPKKLAAWREESRGGVAAPTQEDVLAAEARKGPAAG